jgi:ribosomal protein L10
VRGGVYEKQVRSPAQVSKFKDIPDRRTLLAQILATVTAPLTNVLSLTQSLLSSPAALTQALIQKQEKPAA